MYRSIGKSEWYFRTEIWTRHVSRKPRRLVSIEISMGRYSTNHWQLSRDGLPKKWGRGAGSVSFLIFHFARVTAWRVGTAGYPIPVEKGHVSQIISVIFARNYTAMLTSAWEASDNRLETIAEIKATSYIPWPMTNVDYVTGTCFEFYHCWLHDTFRVSLSLRQSEFICHLLKSFW